MRGAQRADATASTAKTKCRKGRRCAAVAAAPRRPRGQQVIESARAREIQEALIREHYLTGEPNGTWDQDTKEALIRYQGDNGWQTRIVPDSRALIKLGLGPDHSNLLNPEVVNRPESARGIMPGGAAELR